VAINAVLPLEAACPMCPDSRCRFWSRGRLRERIVHRISPKSIGKHGWVNIFNTAAFCHL